MEKPNGGVQRMGPGIGRYSYSLNSMIQSLGIQRLCPILTDVITRFKLPKDRIIRVADLGCSTGANTLTFANIISNGFSTHGASEVQYFFNDLPANDFNTLLQQIPPKLDLVLGGNGNLDIVSFLSKKTQSNGFGSNFQLKAPTLDFGKNTKEMDMKMDTRLYYAAAVPGSYYERLFPSSSLHLVLSTYALHLIPNVPRVVQEKTSIAYNKGQTFFDERNPKALEACGEVYQDNLQKFFTLRAFELVSGGVLVLLFHGRWTNPTTMEINDEAPHPCMSINMQATEASWEDLIHEGLISVELRDSFNFPVYYVSMEEVRMALDKTNVFTIQKMEMREPIFCSKMREQVQKSLFENPDLYGDSMSNYSRAAFGELVEGHIGVELADVYYERLKQNFKKRFPKTKDVFHKSIGEISMVLVRK